MGEPEEPEVVAGVELQDLLLLAEKAETERSSFTGRSKSLCTVTF
jgi:hypothetical protein